MANTSKTIAVTLNLTQAELLKASMLAGYNGALDPMAIRPCLHIDHPLMPFLVVHASYGIHHALDENFNHHFPLRYPSDCSDLPKTEA